MNNLRKTIEILFKKKNPENIIFKHFNQTLKKDNIHLDNNEFLAYFREDNKSLYNKNEITNIYHQYEDLWTENGIFSILLKFTKDILIEENGYPICKYESLFKWRELSFQVGEDLLTTSFLAKEDLDSIKERQFFSWSDVIGNNNHRLNKILEKGIAENHFHLKGSGYHFNISWISLMNNPDSREDEFKKLFKNKKLNPRIDIDFSNTTYDLELLLKKASLIRVFLYGIITNKDILCAGVLGDLLLSKSKSEYNLKINNYKFSFNSIKRLYGKEFENIIPDYCIGKNIRNENYKNKSADVLLFGERFFLYKIFKGLYSKDKKILEYENLFYSYILIKQQFRDEIIQVNKSVGFGNFGDYQERKSIFIPKNSIYEKGVINSAINASILSQNINHLEARITPEKTINKLHSEIKKLDAMIDSDIFSLNKTDYISSKKEDEKKNFMYTLHFIKKEEKLPVKKSPLKLTTQCRNKQNRDDVLKESLIISKLRDSLLNSKIRINGIDGANTEIGCRPEVFAVPYRYLKQIENRRDFFDSNVDLPILGRTFHVGEEFLDIADGLRAIDECINFLNFTHGDRMGHALALGIDPAFYYKSKDYILVLSKQDLLDNIAWILGKTIEKGIDYSSTLKYELESLYMKYYNEVYKDSGINFHCYRTYYESWKLRGDCPEIYKFEMNDEDRRLDLSEFHQVKENKSNAAKVARYNSDAKKLIREYHYNEVAKINGCKIVEFKIKNEYINLIKKIQKVMQFEISEKNISIETNPSSNYLIGTFNRYDEHPITNFFNLGLVSDPDKIKNCPQISVSINTDDQGVFGTRIENEYALIALSLEKKVDEFGNKVYNPSMIYDWIDRIRQMGIEQSFSHRY